MIRHNALTGTWDLDPVVVHEVPALAALQKMRGPLALWYAAYWCRPYGFYARIESAEEKDRAITEAVNLTAPFGQRIVEGIYRDKTFAAAADALLRYFQREDSLFQTWSVLKDKHRDVVGAIDERDPLKPVPKGAPTFKELLDLESQIMVRILEVEAEMAATTQTDDYDLAGDDTDSPSSFE